MRLHNTKYCQCVCLVTKSCIFSACFATRTTFCSLFLPFVFVIWICLHHGPIFTLSTDFTCFLNSVLHGVLDCLPLEYSH